jgi:hypothetical protein
MIEKRDDLSQMIARPCNYRQFDHARQNRLHCSFPAHGFATGVSQKASVAFFDNKTIHFFDGVKCLSMKI